MTWRPLITSLRLHHWVKNLILFFPALTAYRLTDVAIVGPIARAFLAFSCTASAVYLLNDWLDRPYDRSHPTKRRRPIAAGQIGGLTISTAIVLLLGAAAVMAYPIGMAFSLILTGYLALTIVYSLLLKRLFLVDVLTLAMFYTLRVFAGGVAGNIPLSRWLLLFAVFFFFSLALVKRVTELHTETIQRFHQARSYHLTDRQFLSGLGIGSAIAVVVIFVFYLRSAEVVALYQTPSRLWAILPLLGYWLARIWHLAGRRRVDDDPILFALRDPQTYLVAALVFLVLLWAR
ncbi:MAG: UbiA family prenyltransferase [Deltaproteobacteria bacterium]|nr:UbiA family prenyltransferase [Deltaproteobacteria bacterium]